MRGLPTPRLRPAFVLGAALVLAASCMSPARAGQWPHERQGVLLGFNVGVGSADLDLEVDGFRPSFNRETGGAGSFRFGYAVQPNLVLGLETNAWTKTDESDGVEQTWTFGVAALGLTWFPQQDGGLYLRGGVGIGSASLEIDLGNGYSFNGDDQGLGLTGGLGYEWRLTRRFALGPGVDFGWTDVGDGFSMNWVNFTAGFNWYL